MSYTYKQVAGKAAEVQENIKTKYKSDVHNKWAYYFAKAILNPKKDVKKMEIASAPKPSGDYLSRQIRKDGIVDVAHFIVDFVEKEENPKKRRMPNFVRWNNKHIRVRDYMNMLSYCLVFQSKEGRVPNYYNINSKAFTKPTEYPNKVYEMFVKKVFTPKYLDDVCDWVRDKVDYQFYYDDQKSNAEVIEQRAGNCTDLLQFLVNMAEAMGYEWKVCHVKCNQSGVGHVYGLFRKGGDWFIRDIACVADESRYCVWCEAGNGGTLLATNPDWFLENLRR